MTHEVLGKVIVRFRGSDNCVLVFPRFLKESKMFNLNFFTEQSWPFYVPFCIFFNVGDHIMQKFLQLLP